MRITRDLGGGHAWTLHEGVLGDGRRVFVKRSSDASAVLDSEAAGLRWLAEPGAVAVPEVISADGGTLVLEWIDTAPATAGAAERFGRALAALHAAG
ncbi:fructosamine kinase family protein, partial [Microbispora rosea]